MKRKLNVSEKDEYVAVNLIDNEGVIKKTPFYLVKDKPVKLMVYENKTWINAEAVFAGVNHVLIRLTEQGVEYDEPLVNLLNNRVYKFINQ